jgi:hypothetical protein
MVVDVRGGMADANGCVMCAGMCKPLACALSSVSITADAITGSAPTNQQVMFQDVCN